MVNKLSITLSEYVFNLIRNEKNRSRTIEGLILRGYDLNSGDWEISKVRINNLLSDNRNKDDEIKKLKIELGKIKSDKKAKKMKTKLMYMTARAARDNNPAADPANWPENDGTNVRSDY